MPRSAPELRIWLAMALLGLIGPLLAPRDARAMGCHASERPALGLSDRWEPQPVVIALVPADRDEPSRRIMPVPCTGDVPGAPQASATAPGLAQSAPMLPPIRLLGAVRVPRTNLTLPFPPASRLDRPPRRLALPVEAMLA